KRLLVVDDTAANRRIVVQLASRWGMQAMEVSSPTEAMALVDGGAAFDVVVLDVQMPEIDGITLANELRKRPQLKETPLVLSSSLGQEIDTSALGHVVLLPKPFRA